MAKKKWNLYNLLNRDTNKKDAKADADVAKLNFKGYFRLLGRKLSTICSVNLLFVLGNFPMFFGLALFTGVISDKSLAPQTLGFSNLYGVLAHSDPTPLSSLFYGVSGTPVVENEFNKPMLILFIALTCLLFITFGLVNCGCAKILRSAIRGGPVFLFSDFFQTIKKNWKQGLVLGILDLLFLCVLIFDISTFYLNYLSSFFFTVSFFFSIVILFIYMFARMYMYMLAITFDLGVFRIIKNSVIFAFLGFKRNFMALLGQCAALYIMYLFMASGILLSVGVLLPLIILFGFGMFTSYYASYKVIDRYMIEPYYDEEGNARPAKATE